MNDFERFVRHLAETLQARSPDGWHRPVALDDLRRSVLPYRVHRNALGLVSAEDYEALLLRLAAEEGGCVRTFPPEAAERCRNEVASPVPDLALLDELAETTVALEPEAVSRLLAIEDEAPPVVSDSGTDLPLLYEPADEPVAAPQSGPVAESEGKRDRGREPRVPDPEPELSPAPEPEPSPKAAAPKSSSVASSAGSVEPGPPRPDTAGPGASPPTPGSAPAARPAERAAPARPRCLFCAAPLPSGRTVVFCPFCGHQLAATRCPVCDTELEPGWRHCISCGHPMGPRGSGP